MANIALVVAGVLFLVTGSLYISYDSQIAERKTRVQDAVEIVVSYANALSHDTAADPASQAKALEGLLRNVAKVRYDGQTYFNVISADGVFLLQSGNPKLTGTSAFDLTDTQGRHYVRDLFAKVKQDGRGFYNAESPRAGETKLVAKVNYGQALPAFNAVVTSGLYVDDLRAALLWQALLLACIGVPTLLLTGGFSLVIRSSVGGAMVRLAGTMDRLAQGDLGVAIVGTARRDEYGAMARAVQVFKENMIRAEQLAEEVRKASEGALSREAADAAREKFRAEAHTVVSGLAMGLAALADGNLVCSLDTPFAPQYEQLRTDYNAAVTQLRGIIEQIVQNTHAIGDEIGDITKASDDLSHRTEQQAASLEQTVAAVDHLTGTVKKTAEGAQNAQDIAQTARAEAEQSGTVVSDAITAMSEIENSSRQISQIIGVIDEIAFQTSLLALNAGVEAARAGDAGRGFAVVASEVRALAQRAANAAKEIKDLIAASSTHVARGVGLVGETGKALHRIVAQVGQVHTAIAAIAASAKEQATGLQEINTAMNQMDQVTQRNAAMVGESSAASHNLAAETEELARLTGQFKLLAA